MNKTYFFFFVLVLGLPCKLLADGSSIGKVYLPYVHFMEKEIEYQLLYTHIDPVSGNRVFSHKFALGRAIDHKLYLEAGLSFEDENGRPAEAEDYELEARYQLTEQGEYDSDWGLLAELEKSDSGDQWEASLGLLNSKNWQNWLINTNVFLTYEWGNDVNDELETSLALQTLYRHSPLFEPGLELFVAQESKAIGPAMTGAIKLRPGHQLVWLAGIIAGLNEKTPGTTLKLQLEYEFY